MAMSSDCRLPDGLRGGTDGEYSRQVAPGSGARARDRTTRRSVDRERHPCVVATATDAKGPGIRTVGPTASLRVVPRFLVELMLSGRFQLDTSHPVTDVSPLRQREIRRHPT